MKSRPIPRKSDGKIGTGKEGKEGNFEPKNVKAKTGKMEKEERKKRKVTFGYLGWLGGWMDGGAVWLGLGFEFDMYDHGVLFIYL